MTKTELMHIFKLLCVSVLGCVVQKFVNLNQMEDRHDFVIYCDFFIMDTASGNNVIAIIWRYIAQPYKKYEKKTSKFYVESVHHPYNGCRPISLLEIIVVLFFNIHKSAGLW